MSLSNRRRYGGYVVHFGVVLVAVGIAASSSYKQETEATLRPGESVEFGRYTLQLDSVWARREPQRDVVGATVDVSSGGDALGAFNPRINHYPNSDQPILTPAVRYSLREDLYLTVRAYERDGSSATLKAFISPLVTWIWIGGGVMGLGALFALWPARRREPPRVSRVSPTPARPEEEISGVAS